MATEPAKPLRDGPLAIVGVFTKPGSVSRRFGPVIFEVDAGIVGVILGCACGGGKHDHMVRCAARIGRTRNLVAGDDGASEITGELDLNNIPNSRVDVLGSSVGTNVGKEVRWFDAIVSSARSGEVVRCGHWW